MVLSIWKFNSNRRAVCTRFQLYSLNVVKGNQRIEF
jgi:hypothetical protein